MEKPTKPSTNCELAEMPTNVEKLGTPQENKSDRLEMLSRKQIRNIVPNIVPSDFLFDQVKRLKTYLEDPLEGSQQKERGNKRKRRQ